MSRTGLLGFGLIGFGVAGEHYAFSTLPAAVCLTLVTLALDFAWRRPRTVRLLDVWCFAFAYLFGSDALLSLADVRADFGMRLAGVAEGVIVAAFGATLVGYGAANLFAPGAGLRRGSRQRPRATRNTIALMGLSTLVLLYLALAVSPQDLLALRSARSGTGVQGPMFVAVVATMIVQAALTTQVMTTARFRPILFYPMAVAALSLVVLYTVGTRYFLGFFACALLFPVVRFSQPLSRRRIAVLAVAVVALAAAQGTMRLIRGTGLSGADSAAVGSSLGHAETFFSSEAMLRVHAWVHDKAVYENRDRPPEHAFLAYWWVPRSVWPNKPTMDGFWLAHEVMADGDVGAGHNVAGGFCLPALLDFGPHLGVAVCLFYGLLLLYLDRFVARHGDPASPASIFAALLPFGVFFAMRSPQTSAIFVESCIVAYLPVFLFLRAGRRARSRRIVRPVVGAPRHALAPFVAVAAQPSAIRGVQRWRR